MDRRDRSRARAQTVDGLLDVILMVNIDVSSLGGSNLLAKATITPQKKRPSLTAPSRARRVSQRFGQGTVPRPSESSSGTGITTPKAGTRTRTSCRSCCAHYWALATEHWSAADGADAVRSTRRVPRSRAAPPLPRPRQRVVGDAALATPRHRHHEPPCLLCRNLRLAEERPSVDITRARGSSETTRIRTTEKRFPGWNELYKPGSLSACRGEHSVPQTPILLGLCVESRLH